jgi:lipopolysaccharide exporter
LLTSLRKRTVRAVRWTALSAVVVSATFFLQLYIATQVVSPEELGLFYVVLLFFGFLQKFTDGGFTYAIIHRQTISDEELSSVYWLTVLLGVLLYAVFMIAGAPLIAAAYSDPRLEHLVFLAALGCLVVPFGIPYLTLLQKALEFNVIAKVEVVSAVAGLLAMIAAIVLGYRLESLVISLSVNNLVKTLMFVNAGIRGWRPRFYLNISESMFFLKFGGYQIGIRLLEYTIARMDRFLISVFLGVDALGYYSLAWNCVVDPVLRINPIVTRVLIAVFAKIQDQPDSLKRGFLNLIELVAMINMPIAAGAAALAPVAVPLIFGPEWSPAVPILQILAIVAAATAVGNPTGALVFAKGRADLGFRWNVVALIAEAPILLLAAHSGSILVLTGTLAGLQVFVLGGIYWLLYRPLLGPCLGEWLRRIAGPLAFSIVMALVVGAAAKELDLHGVAGIALLVALGALVYGALYALLRRDMLIYATRLTLAR